MHNNWIIDNHQLGDASGQKSSKNKLPTSSTNKSVIIVKPNHGSSSLDVKNSDKLKDSTIFSTNTAINQNAHQNNSASNNASRSSLRKMAGS